MVEVVEVVEVVEQASKVGARSEQGRAAPRPGEHGRKK